MLRFRTASPPTGARKYAAYSAISRVLKCSTNTVQHLCRYRSRRPSLSTPSRKARTLELEHMKLLIATETLKRWAGLTLKERTILFEQRYPDKRLAVTSLRRFYLTNGIKIKKVRQEKIMPVNAWAKFDENRREVISQVNEARAEGRKLIYLDEIAFTKRSFCGRSWSRTNENIHVDQQQIYQGFRTVIASCSAERGIELIHVNYQPTNNVNFREFVDHLIRTGGGPIALFMDQLGAHKSNDMMKFYADHDIKPILNVGYSPEFNPIEAVFSQVKRSYSRVRLNKLANDELFDQTAEVRAAFNKVTPALVRACIGKSWN